MSLEDLNSKFKKEVNGLQNTWETAINQLKANEEDMNKELDQIRKEKAELQEKYDSAQSKIDKIEGQLANTIDQMKSMSKATDKGIDAMQLLDVYLVLMENVFESQVHTRLLIMLHGAKETYTLKELTKAAGISGIQVRQAVFDLRNAGILDFNEETEEITLKMRFLE